MRLFALFLTLVSATPSLRQVETSSGILHGFINSSAPNVLQFLGVPYALPPTGVRRWLPPSKFSSNLSINASNIGPSCPQLLVTSNSQLNASVFSPNGGGETEYFPIQNQFNEDCLTLNVWSPANSSKAMPVFVWYFGGGFIQGGTNSPYYNPQSWVQRTQEHIVVTVNFRSNIFGFPNIANMTNQNLGLLDQRSALEWVRDNIAAFGGDASKIVEWGESGGAIAIDYLNFAYPLDPIVSGKIISSGTALFPQNQRQSSDTSSKNFTAVAKAFGCVDTTSQVDCLRNVSWSNIENFLQAEAARGFTFIPIVDNVTVFSNYLHQYSIGALSPVPAIVGTNQHELNALWPTTSNESHNSIAHDLDFLTNTTWLCPAAQTAQLRESNSRITYRYRYDGNFTNISPNGNFSGAYHASELPLIFGTDGNYHGASTEYEKIVSSKLQDLWLAFANDPLDGLRNLGWSTYSEGKAVVIGGSNNVLEEVDISNLDSVC